MLKKWSKYLPRNRNVVSQLHRCHPGNDLESWVDAYYEKKLKMMLLIAAGSAGLSVLMLISSLTKHQIDENGVVRREGYQGANQSIEVIVSDEDKTKETSMTIKVDHQRYSKQEIETIFDQVENWLFGEMLLQNESLQAVQTDLYFPTQDEEYQIAIAYQSGNYSLVDDNGQIHNQELEVATTVHMKAILAYEEYDREIGFDIQVLPANLTLEQSFQKSVSYAVDAENKAQNETEELRLPYMINGEKITYREKQENQAFILLLIGIVASAVLYKGMDRDLEKEYMERQNKLLMSYPEFVSKLALLTGAGMSVVGAIKRIHEGMKEQDENPLQEEIGIFLRHLKNGVLEEVALDALGQRTGLTQYRKFCSLLSTNMKKGSLSLKDLLEKEASDAFENHQMQIRKLGEEAGTKLLIPMIMMLGVVMILVMIPAFMTYQIS